MIKKIYHFLIAYISYWYYGRPSRKMIVIGVTGTKGKSITCRYISSVLEAGGYKVGLLSTVDIQIAGRRVLNKYKMTMLGRGKIQKMLKKMVIAGCQYAVIETSSEGILQYRHLGLNYDIAVITNLGTEHSERHKGFENLKRDKGKLFSGLQKRKTINGKSIKKVIVVNGHDEHADFYYNFPADEKWVCSIDGNRIKDERNLLKARNIQTTKNGTSFELENKYTLGLIGDFNVVNALFAVAVGKSQNVPEDKIKQGLESVKKVEGRMEYINQGQDFSVIVDFAHEPMSLTALFNTLRKLLTNNGRLISIVGSDGGGRDKGKREKMGEVAGRLSDFVIITDVNCFDENPKVIAQMLAIGARSMGKKEDRDLFIIIDRKQAIQKAFNIAKKDDIVVITGKGTEPCIVQAGGKKIPWDDKEVAQELLKKLNN